MSKIYLSENETLNEALKRARHNDILILRNKDYREKVFIEVDGLTLIGEEGTRIVYDDYANKINEDGFEYNTFRTPTVTVLSLSVTIRNIIIENDSYNPRTNGQAVALSVLGNYFRAEFVTIKSAQDTLFLGPLPDDLIVRYNGFLPDNQRSIEGSLYSTFYECDIFGSIDYVFGCGVALFSQCRFTNINDGRSIGYIAAPSHSLKQSEGFVFSSCSFLKAPDLNAEVFLARPWRDFGKCTFIDCSFGSHISKKGFDKWNESARDTTARFELSNCTPLASCVNWSKTVIRDNVSVTSGGQFPLVRK